MNLEWLFVCFNCAYPNLRKYTGKRNVRLNYVRIITLFKRAPELTEEQEKKLHQLGRKVRKKFEMKPIRMEE